MQLFVQGRALHTVDVSTETSIETLKALVADLEGIPTEDQVLAYGGVPLEEDCLLCGLVPELGTITVSARVVGGGLEGSVVFWEWEGCVVLFKAYQCSPSSGKVHGSLARAGKVRGQTPKVTTAFSRQPSLQKYCINCSLKLSVHMAKYGQSSATAFLVCITLHSIPCDFCVINYKWMCLCLGKLHCVYIF